MHWWGVGTDTVWKWRRALGVVGTTGTAALRARSLLGEHGERIRAGVRAMWDDPQRREEIVAARRGRPKPPHVVEAMRRANLGRVPTEETRRRISEAAKRRWRERKLLRVLPAAVHRRIRPRRGTGVHKASDVKRQNFSFPPENAISAERHTVTRIQIGERGIGNGDEPGQGTPKATNALANDGEE
jgi:hypothetical protein